MATLTLNMSSKTLRGDIAVTYFLPEKQLQQNTTQRYEFPVLYLLHGYGGSNNVFERFTTLESYAREMNIIIVMPDGKNSFYRDAVYGQKYYTFVQDELQHFTKNLFPVSSKSKDTFIAGNSMGGYGALNLALQAPEKYGAIGLFSALIDIEYALNKETMYGFQLRHILGNEAENIKNTLHDNLALLREKSLDIPPILQLCGEDDFLIEQNRTFAQLADDYSLQHTYKETPGEHDWDYWEMCLKEFLLWLPIHDSLL